MKRAVSVTVGEDNLLWLRAQAAASARGSVSEVLDRLVTEARMQGRTDRAAIRSVAGTIDLPPDDPNLETAGTYVRAMFDRSLHRPMLVKERPPRAKKRRG
ncbi:MAG TPA: hypothetical protein VEL51_05325 [Vicinamibacterales bacterium]|nr:hypothetical protein [Vicinamibacterales bacterium]